MKRRIAYAETAAVAVAACVMIVVGARSLHPDLLNAVYSTDAWAERSGVMRSLFVGYGAALAALAVASFVLIRYHRDSLCARAVRGARSVGKECADTWVWVRGAAGRSGDGTWRWLAAICAAGAAVRIVFLAAPMQYDEAYTFLNYVNRSAIYLFAYPDPNNHILHTLLARVSVAVFGGHPAVIRLPALLSGVCVIPLTFVCARLCAGGHRSGFVAAALAAVYPYLIFYGTTARGYSLVVMLCLVLAVLVRRLISGGSLRLCALISMVIALGVAAMPSFLFAAAGLLCWATVGTARRRDGLLPALRDMLMPCSVMAAGLVGLLYTPTAIVSNGVHSIVSGGHISVTSWRELLGEVPGHLARSARVLTGGIHPAVIVVGLLLCAVGACLLFRSREADTVALFPALAIGGAVVLLAVRAIPYPRTWIYLLPFAFVLTDAGAAGIVPSAGGLFRGAMLACAGVCVALVMTGRVVPTDPDAGCFPEAPAVVEFLSGKMHPGDLVEAKCPASAPVRFYLWYLKVPRGSREGGVPVPETFFVVQKSRYSLADLTSRDARRILETGDAEVYVAEHGMGGGRP